MTLSTVLTWLTLAVAAADECSFDQAHQAQLLRAVRETVPGSTLDLGERRVSWQDPVLGEIRIGFGGCHDLGSVVSVASGRSAPRSPEEVVQLAKELVRRHWAAGPLPTRQAAAALIAGIDQSDAVPQANGDLSVMEIEHPDHAELSVSHRYQDGIDTVVIAWQGIY